MTPAPRQSSTGGVLSFRPTHAPWSGFAYVISFTLLGKKAFILWCEYSDGMCCLGVPLMLAFLVDLLTNEDGVTAIEYGLIAALIAVAAVVVMGQVGVDLSSTFNTIASNL